MSAMTDRSAALDGLIAVARTLEPERAQRLIARHPERSALQALWIDRKGLTLDTMLARLSGESTGARSGDRTIGSPASRFRDWKARRRKACLDRLAQFTRETGLHWLQLARVSDGIRGVTMERLGVLIFAVGLRGETAQSAFDWMKPLEDVHCRLVIDAAHEHRARAVERDVVERWHRACSSIRGYRGVRAVQRMALGLAADRIGGFSDGARDTFCELLPEFGDSSAKLGMLSGVPDRELADELLRSALAISGLAAPALGGE